MQKLGVLTILVEVVTKEDGKMRTSWGDTFHKKTKVRRGMVCHGLHKVLVLWGIVAIALSATQVALGNERTDKLNNVISVDGVTYTGAQALQSAIQACSGSSCVVDARNPLIGTQTFTVNPFAGLNMPITLLTGPYTVQWDTSSIAILLPSHVHWSGNNTVIHSTAPFVTNNTVPPNGMINNLTYSTTGSISSGSNSLTVASATGAEVGSMVSVLGANGPEIKQFTTINQAGGIGAGDTSFTVTSTSGWSTTITNYLEIGSEILSCSGGTGTTFTGCARGLFGTTAASHANGVTVNAVGNFFSRITTVSGTTLTLMDNAAATVTSAKVGIGTQDISLEGSLTIDAQSNGSTDRGLDGVVFTGATRCNIASSVKFQNIDDYGVALVYGSRYNYVDGVYQNNSTDQLAADVLIFGNSSYNTVRTVSHNVGTKALAIDDRSNSYNVGDGPSNNNFAVLGPITGGGYGPTSGQPAIDIEGGSSYNFVQVPYLDVKAGGYGIGIISAQWTTNPVPQGNTVTFGFINDATGTALYSTGYTPGGSGSARNTLLGGEINGTTNLVAGDNLSYIGTSNATNGWSTDQYAMSMTRSAGNSGFPDVFGDGTHALVLGGQSNGSGVVAMGTTSYLLMGTVTVGLLPAAGSGNAGQLVRVSDSTTVTTEGQTCVGSSTHTALAFSNGTVWKCF